MLPSSRPQQSSEKRVRTRQNATSNGGAQPWPPAARCVQNPDVEVRCEDERGAVLLDARTGQVRGLNATGLFIWRLCDGTRDVPALVAALRLTFEDVPEDIVSDQVVSFLDTMHAAGLVLIADSRPGTPPDVPGDPGIASRAEIE